MGWGMGDIALDVLALFSSNSEKGKPVVLEAVRIFLGS